MSEIADCIPRPTVDLGPFAGAQLLGIFAAMALWGVTCMQTFLFFFNNDPRDTWRIKALVLWLWVMDTVHQGLLISGNYKATVTGMTLNLSNTRAEYIISILFTTLVSAPVQTFFAWRIWKFGNVTRWIFVGILFPAILFQFVEGLLLVVFNSQLTTSNEITQRLGLSLIIANLSCAAAVDLIIAVGLCLLLWRTYLVNDTNVKATSSMVQRLILFSVNNGVWTAAIAITTMTTAAVYPGNYIYNGFYFVLSPLYCNMFLANMNARGYIRGGSDADARGGIIDFSKSGGSSGFALRQTAFAARTGEVRTGVTEGTTTLGGVTIDIEKRYHGGSARSLDGDVKPILVH